MHGHLDSFGGHGLLGEAFEAVVEPLELLEVLEHGLDRGVDHVVLDDLSRHHHRDRSERPGVAGRALVHAAGNGGGDVVVVALHQRVHRRSGHFRQHDVAEDARITQMLVRIAVGDDDGVELVVAQRRHRVFRVHLGRGREGRRVPPELRHQHLHRIPVERTRLADVHPLAFELVEVLDTGVGAGGNRERLGMEGEDRADIAIGAGRLEAPVAVVGLVHPASLGHRHGELALAAKALQTVDVLDVALGILRLARDAVFRRSLVDEPANPDPRGVIGAPDMAGSDDDRLLAFSGRDGCLDLGFAREPLLFGALRDRCRRDDVHADENACHQTADPAVDRVTHVRVSVK